MSYRLDANNCFSAVICTHIGLLVLICHCYVVPSPFTVSATATRLLQSGAAAASTTEYRNDKKSTARARDESKKEFGYLRISLCFEPFVELYIRDDCFLASKKGSCKYLLQKLVSVQSPQMVFICPNHNFLKCQNCP